MFACVVNEGSSRSREIISSPGSVGNITESEYQQKKLALKPSGVGA